MAWRWSAVFEGARRHSPEMLTFVVMMHENARNQWTRHGLTRGFFVRTRAESVRLSRQPVAGREFAGLVSLSLLLRQTRGSTPSEELTCDAGEVSLMLWRLYRAEVALKGEGSGREDRHGWVDVDFARWDSKLRDWSSLPMDGESDALWRRGEEVLPPRTLSAWLQSLVALVVAVDAPGQAVSSDSVSTRRALLRLLEAWMVVFDGVSSLDAGSGSEQDNVDAFGFAKQLLDVIAARPSAPWLMKLWSLCGNWRESEDGLVAEPVRAIVRVFLGGRPA